MNVRRAAVAVLLFAACTSEPPSVTSIGPSGDAFVVDIAGDGFVRAEGRRLPLEAVVLELRQRTRAMSSDERLRFVVHLRVDPQLEGSDAAAVASRGVDRLMRELQIMGVGTAKLL